MGKYTCEAGQFTCSICGTVYPYSDLRDICEGRAWYLREPEKELVLDDLGAEVGEKVLQTTYFGDDHVLLWEWIEVREKRIVPTGMPIEALWEGKMYRHLAQYKIARSHEKIVEVLGDRWDDNVSGGVLAVPVGPRHFWSKHLVDVLMRRKHPELIPANWEEFVYNMCQGERTEARLQELKAQGYPV